MLKEKNTVYTHTHNTQHTEEKKTAELYSLSLCTVSSSGRERESEQPNSITVSSDMLDDISQEA
jgi:hypothetical protein